MWAPCGHHHHHHDYSGRRRSLSRVEARGRPDPARVPLMARGRCTYGGPATPRVPERGWAPLKSKLCRFRGPGAARTIRDHGGKTTHRPAPAGHAGHARAGAGVPGGAPQVSRVPECGGPVHSPGPRARPGARPGVRRAASLASVASIASLRRAVAACGETMLPHHSRAPAVRRRPSLSPWPQRSAAPKPRGSFETRMSASPGLAECWVPRLWPWTSFVRGVPG